MSEVKKPSGVTSALRGIGAALRKKVDSARKPPQSPSPQSGKSSFADKSRGQPKVVSGGGKLAASVSSKGALAKEKAASGFKKTLESAKTKANAYAAAHGSASTKKDTATALQRMQREEQYGKRDVAATLNKKNSEIKADDIKEVSRAVGSLPERVNRERVIRTHGEDIGMSERNKIRQSPTSSARPVNRAEAARKAAMTRKAKGVSVAR